MGAVSADGEQELEQELVGGLAEREVGAPVLPADQAELGGLVSEEKGSAGVVQRVHGRQRRAIVAEAGEPAPRELVVAGDLHPEGLLQAVRLGSAAPDKHAADR